MNSQIIWTLHFRWLGLIGQFRPMKLISSIKANISAVDEWELSTFKEVAKHFIDKSLFSFGLCSQLSLTPSSSLMVSTEKHGDKKGLRSRVMLFHQACISMLLVLYIFVMWYAILINLLCFRPHFKFIFQ